VSLEDKLYPLLSIYERFPDALKSGLGFTFRQLPESVRRGKHYRRFKQLVEAGESWDQEQIHAYQLQELRKTLHQANGFCPFYTKRFAQAGFRPERLQSVDDLKACPLLEKRDLLEHREEMVATNIPAERRLFLTTGGTTGEPVGFYLEKGIGRAKEQAFREAMWKRGGYFDDARMAMLRGHITSTTADGRISSYDATRDWLVLSSYHLSPERLPLYLEKLERFKPDLLYTFASTALQFAEYLEAAGHEWRVPLRGVLCSSERLTVPQQRIIERVFKARCYTWYGHTERVVLAAWGRKSQLYYFHPQYGLAEFGPPDAQGLREVIGTTFDNLAMPLVRYRTGDYVRLLEDDSVEKEYPWPAATEIAGREQEFVFSGTGRKISLATFNMHDDIFEDIYSVQFYQDRPGVIAFRYIPGPGFNSARLPRIEAGLRRKLGDDFELTLHPVQEVERTARGKHKWLVSKLQDR
jgi:phenylacetate-CoA ligase